MGKVSGDLKRVESLLAVQRSSRMNILKHGILDRALNNRQRYNSSDLDIHKRFTWGYTIPLLDIV